MRIVWKKNITDSHGRLGFVHHHYLQSLNPTLNYIEFLRQQSFIYSPDLVWNSFPSSLPENNHLYWYWWTLFKPLRIQLVINQVTDKIFQQKALHFVCVIWPWISAAWTFLALKTWWQNNLVVKGSLTVFWTVDVYN